MKIATCFCLMAAISTSSLAQQDPTLRCINELAQLPELTILQNKAPVLTTSQTFDMLTNSDKASGEELPAIKAWAQGRERCQALGDSYRRSIPTGVTAAIEAAYRDFLNMLADLYTGNLTYGEFARRRAERNTQTASQIQRAAEEYNRGVAQKNQAAAQEDAARRDAAIQILLNRPPAPTYQPAVPYQTPTPRVTNCVPDGIGGMRCTTR